ncbi:MAG: hypothetical protein J6V24_10570 [Clostridia bacterium]|nr:hypothetical protein [Clostridia bacterium]
MTRESMDLIRDEAEVDAFCEPDDDMVERCDGCGEPVYAGDEAMGIVVRQGDGKDHPFCLCRACVRDMTLNDVLDVLWVTYFENDAEKSIPTAWRLAREHNMRAQEQFRRVITTAATIAKGARV